MRIKLLRPLGGLLLASALMPGLFAQGTGTFTYQGRLTDAAGPASGVYEFRFSVHDAPSGGQAVATPMFPHPVPVTDGLFTTWLNFGQDVFTGDPRWLEIAVRTNGAVAFTTLSPRQLLTATPYALYARNAGNTLLLDGQSAAAYAPAAGSPSYLAKAGDTMTGPLILPANGLVVGGNQLALSAGNVGIGTANPGGALEIASAGQHLKLTRSGVGTAFGMAVGVSGPGDAVLSLMNWDTGNGLAIDPDGKVGIGTTYPASRLHVQGAGDTEISIQSIDPGSHRWTLQASGNEPGQGRFEIIDRTLSVNRLTILTNGNVGIGTATPAQTLDVVGAVSGYGLTSDGASPEGGSLVLRNQGKTGTAANVWALFNMTGDYGDSFQIWSYAANGWVYRPRLILTDDGTTVLAPWGGRVGIGTASPAATLDVAGDIVAAGLNLRGNAALSDHSLLLRSDTDINHGLRWSGPGRPFAGTEGIDGPVLYGWNSGALGTTTSGERVVLQWNQWGWVGITGGLQTPDVQVSGTTQTGVLQITGGADVAEPFELSGEDIPQGAVVVIDEENPGRLKVSQQAYDTRVAGIISGANGVQPGLTLSHPDLVDGGQNVALSGRVYVQADATHAPIKPGDLLTTADVPGHAMKVTDHARAQGAILGKAMSGLKEGNGLVLVLVSLQ